MAEKEERGQGVEEGRGRKSGEVREDDAKERRRGRKRWSRGLEEGETAREEILAKKKKKEMSGGGMEYSMSRPTPNNIGGGGSTGGGVGQHGIERCGFQMPLHYPRYTKAEYETMPEWKLNCLLAEYGLPATGDVNQKRKFAMGAFLWAQ
ncbi:hypothetical protein ACH5RR_024157 [Cinchona calisaya]|uniref:DUF7722 domain-containing protein n=1 Tax=Cinchona calisaya TaxID=153742 RepID=A0ABD2ZG19_9GENT